MKLVIAEKPSVGQAIAAVLGATERKDGCFTGNGWIVAWCVGHLVELAPADAYDERLSKWNYAYLPILPEQWRFAAYDDKKKHLNILKRLMFDDSVDTVICATDAGREGELIFRLVYDYCGCKKPVQRLWISSMEDTAIREGFARLRPGADYDKLYQAALCRARADWLVGINATRLFSVHYGATLHVGRVQTPTLAMIVERERQIAAFQKEPFYTVEINTGTFTASGERLKDLQNAESICSACDGMAAVVRDVKRYEKSIAPPRLYDLTTLQREANRLFGYTAQQTLDYTQSLYEKKLVTYPRTDSRFLTSDMADGLPALVKSIEGLMPFINGFKYPTNITQVIDDKKVTDHHAIIPTQAITDCKLAALPTGEGNILRMLAIRLICAIGDKNVYNEVIVIVDCQGYNFTAKGKTILREGWKTIENIFRDSLKNKTDDDTDDGDITCLPKITKGQRFSSVSAGIREGFTAAPKSFTEDTLLAAMEAAGSDNSSDEQKGLGTPATRAGVIERLVNTGLVERRKKCLIASEKGVNLITILPDMIKSPNLTAVWEHRLKQIEDGELDERAFMTEIAAMTLGLVKAHPTPDKEYMSLFAKPPAGDIVGICPRCGGFVHENAKGFCCADRACGFSFWKNNKFFTSKRKVLNKETAAALLKDRRVFYSDLYSGKTGKTYGAAVVLDDTGEYVNFKLEFQQKAG